MMHIAAFYFLGSALILAAILLITKQKKNSYSSYKYKDRKKKKSLKLNPKLYKELNNNKLFSPLISYVEDRQGTDRISDSAAINQLSILLKSLSIFFVFALLLIPLASNIHILIGSCIALSFIFVNSVDFFIAKHKTKLLQDFVYFLELFRTKYFESCSQLDSALFEALQAIDSEKYSNLTYEIEYILELIESPNSELELRDYYQIAPNSYFKIFAGLLAINKENGDVIKKGESHFAKSLSELSAEMKDEIMLRDRLNYSLRSLSFIALLPLFLLDPIKNWASSSFYPLQKFFTSAIGISTEITLILLILSANYALSRLKVFHTEGVQRGSDSIYTKLPAALKRIIDFISPQKETERYEAKKSLMQSAMDFSRVENLYAKKALFFLGVFALILTLSAYGSLVSRKSILLQPTVSEGYMGGELKGRELEEAMLTTEKDRALVLAIVKSKGSEEENNAILDLIKKGYGGDYEDTKITLSRLIAKARAYKDAGLKPSSIILAYIIACMSFFIPELSLYFKSKLLRLDSIAELSKFQLIILLLMHIKKIEISNILEWMEMFASVYKKPIQEAIMDYDSGNEDALRVLKSKVDDEEFKKIIEHMISAASNLSVEQAFQNLENEKNYYEMKRKTTFERIVSQKSAYGRIAGFMPTYSLILLYFMFPLIYSGFKEINTYFGML